MAKVYFHIDLNAFYANAEILLEPRLKGKPVVVSGETRRSVVATASYEARKYGINSAMPINEALKRCDQLIVRQPHFAFYRSLSDQFMDLIKSFSDKMEIASIDECYVDVTEIIATYDKPLDLAWDIQNKVLNELGLPCSIGVGPNLFLAKMASDMKKPLGITVLRIRDVSFKLWPLPIEQMRGVGVKTAPLLRDLGINTIGDLANYREKDRLFEIFGKNTEQIINRANGYDNRVLEIDPDIKSLGVSETFLEDIIDEDEIYGVFRRLSRKLSKRARNEAKLGKDISVKIRYYDFQTITRSKSLNEAIWKSEDIFREGMKLFHDNWNGEPIRLIGISLTNFVTQELNAQQINLFDQKQADEEETDSVINDLNKMLSGIGGLQRASNILKDD